MLPPSLAFAWLLWRQHRIGFFLVLGYLLLVGILSAVLSPYCSPGTITGFLGGLGTVSLGAIPVFLLGVFAYGCDAGDVLARESCFPARWFRLPVPTSALVVWPMVYGAAAAILLWPMIAYFILRPWTERLGHEMPLWWPGVFTAASLAWVQALLWSPFGLPWLRVISFLILYPLLFVLAVFSAETKTSEFLLVALHAGLMLIGWVIGYVGVAHARHGQVSDWRALLEPLRTIASWLPRSRAQFRSAARAQAWFEWKRTGITLAISTGLTLVTVLAPLLLPKNDVIPTVQTLLSALAVPVFLAGLCGGWPGTDNNHWIKDRPGIVSFIATLPMSCADMVGAMLKTAVWSSLAAWSMVLVMVPLAVVLTGKMQEVTEGWQQIVRECSPGEIVAGILTIPALLFVWTWKRKVDGLYLGLTGRVWIAGAILWGCFVGYLALFVTIRSIVDHPETHELIFRLLPWLLTLLLLGRLLLASWALRQVLRQGLVRQATVARWLTAWVLLASALVVGLAWAIPMERVPVYYLAFAVAFVMPMARLTAAPLVLAWNRHR